jgi:hypothetical protein
MQTLPPDAECSLPRQMTFRPTSSIWRAWLGELQIEPAQQTQPLRFRLGELFLAVTIAAGLLALFRAAGIIGAVLSFVSALLFTNVLYQRWRSPAQQAAMFDFVWGIVMPVVCLVFDPFLFKAESNFWALGEPSLWSFSTTPEFFGRTIPAYAFVGTQILCLGIWLVAGRLPADVSAVWSGILYCGFAFSAIVAVVLLVPAILGVTFFGVGLLGFTPFFTTRAFHRRVMLAGAIAAQELAVRRVQWLAILGYCLSLPLPIALYAFIRGFYFF